MPPPPPPGSAHLSAPVQTRWHHVRAVPVRPWFTLVPSPPSFTCPVGLLRVLTPPPLPACPHILTSSRPHVCRSLGPGALLLHLLHPVPGPGGAAPLPRRLWVPPPTPVGLTGRGLPFPARGGAPCWLPASRGALPRGAVGVECSFQNLSRSVPARRGLTPRIGFQAVCQCLREHVRSAAVRAECSRAQTIRLICIYKVYCRFEF